MDKILNIVTREIARKTSVDPDTPLLSSGLIDSFGIAGLIIAIEREFQLQIDVLDVGVDNFDTVAQIHRYVETHLRADSDRKGSQAL